MAGSVNKVTLLGYVCGDAEIRATQNGNPVANFRIATTEKWTSKDGEKKENTEFHSIVVWNEGLRRLCENFVKKGTLIYVEGKQQTRKYTDSQGVDKYTTETVLQNFGSTIQLLGGNSNKQEQSQGGYEQQPNGAPDLDEDIVF